MFWSNFFQPLTDKYDNYYSCSDGEFKVCIAARMITILIGF